MLCWREWGKKTHSLKHRTFCLIPDVHCHKISGTYFRMISSTCDRKTVMRVFICEAKAVRERLQRITLIRHVFCEDSISAAIIYTIVLTCSTVYVALTLCQAGMKYFK